MACQSSQHCSNFVCFARQGVAQGFTLIELIMVMVLLGILAAYAAPRIFNRSDFDARGFHDETLALLRYAQKSAIAQRRAVCVNLAATGVTMTMFANNPATGTCATAPALNPPFTPTGGTGLAGSVAAFQFSPLGATDQGAAITVTVPNSTSITIEAATGYVHD